MAPTRKNPGAAARRRKLEAFLQDFDSEVESRIARLEENGERLVKEVDDMYDMHILRLPEAFREMNWLEFFGTAPGRAAGLSLLLNPTAITEPPGSVLLPSPLPRGKFTQHLEAIQEVESLLPQAKKAEHEGQCLPDVNDLLRQSNGWGFFSFNRSSKNSFITPATGRMVGLCAPGGSSMPTPRFDPSIFKTPGLRAPVSHERVYTVSANGSPLAAINDIFITVPVGGGESVGLAASDVTKNNLLHLNAEVQGFMQKLSVRSSRTSLQCYKTPQMKCSGY
uniref:Borealin n=1 Tax=Melopsittacus undulatus TaxID=13146 RepID=A0A8C6JBB6_MELUD